MTRFALTTKYSSYNFGAMLQTYALCRTIESLGAECKVVDADRPQRPYSNNGSSLGDMARGFFYKLHKSELDLGYNRFESFLDEFNKTQKYAHYGELKANPPEADVYLSGSDQVWNPLNVSKNYFLRYAPQDAIRASYAASLGISYMPKGASQIFKEYINQFDYVSVRENKGAEIVEEATGKKAQVHVDPTLLLSKEQWGEIAATPNFNKPYILCYILYRPDWLNGWLKKLHKKTGKEIVVLTSDAYRNVYHTKMVRDAGPKEMLGWIRNADFVISSSFHGAALSIANEKDFYAVVNPDAPSRLSNLLETFGLEERVIDPYKPFTFEAIEFSSVEKLRLYERERSLEYLNFLVSKPQKQPFKAEEKTILKGDISLVGDACTACKACSAVCPTSAIVFERNNEGFEYPVIDREKCINCSKCIRGCHAVNPAPLTNENCDVYYGWSKKTDTRETSTSGGAFSAIADKVLSTGGAVFGAYFDAQEKRVIHGCSNYIDPVKFRRSKYVESDIGDSIEKIGATLKENREVLFCGTPCQCAGVRSVFGNHEKLILCDFFCHGVPSPKLFKDFLLQKERNAKDKITNYSFRTKDFGWSQYGMRTEYASGNQERTVGRCEFFYTASMLDNLFLRKSCYTCGKNVSHAADFTIGDFWGYGKLDPKLNDEKGISVIIANTPKAKNTIAALGNNCEFKNIDTFYIDYAFKVKTADKAIDRRNKKFEEYNRLGIDAFENKYYKKRLYLSRIMFGLKKKKLQKGADK